MIMAEKQLTGLDNLICGFDRVLRTLTPSATRESRPCPTPKHTCKSQPTGGELSAQQRRHSAALMRVNHTGEVCAQALYQGQELTAKLPEVRHEMAQAAAEEIDHLAWCEQRIEALGGHVSRLNPLWYGLSFGLGASAGLISDKVSLGFVAATEEQVCAHLREHLEKLPKGDLESRAIVEQMLEEEEKHGRNALEAGGYNLPKPIKGLMALTSKVMTKTSYHL